MRESQIPAGQDPAPPSGSTAEEDFTAKHVVPATTRLHSALAACDALILALAQRARDDEHYSFTSQTEFALAAAKLAAVQAQTSTAIARLADAESRQRLTNVKVDDAAFRPRRHRTADINRAIRNSRSLDSYNTRDWENDESGEEKSTFNSPFTGPRIRQV